MQCIRCQHDLGFSDINCLNSDGSSIHYMEEREEVGEMEKEQGGSDREWRDTESIEERERVQNSV